MRNWTITLSCLFAASLLSPEARAQTHRYEFTGTLDGIIGGGGDWAGITEGDPLLVTVEFDANATGGIGIAGTTSYNAITSTTVTIGPVTHSSLDGGSILIGDDEPVALIDPCEDLFLVEPFSGGAWDGGMDISLIGGGMLCPSLVTSELLTTPVDVSMANSTSAFSLLDISPSVVILDGTITSAILSPLNDDCENATVLPSAFGTTPYNAFGATTDGADSMGLCDYGPGMDQNHNDIWFEYTPAVGGCTYITTLNQAGYDTRLAVYESASCPDDPATIIACVDDELNPSITPFEAGLDVNLTAGQTYLIRLGTFSATTPAESGSITIASGPGAELNSGGNNPGAPGCITPPANDDCSNAIALGGSAFVIQPYDAAGATTDGADAAGFCDYGAFGDEINHRDIWFTYTPDAGGCYYITTVNNAGYDSRLTVYDTADCPDDPARIIACVDDAVLPSMTPFEAGLDVTLQQGRTYAIRLGTFSEATNPSTGNLVIQTGPGAEFLNNGMTNPGAPGCEDFQDFCNGDGGNQLGCTNCPCMNNAPPGTIGGCLNSAATSARLIGSGSTSVTLPSGSTTDLRFDLTGAPPTAFCVLLSGAAIAPQNMANPCFGLDSGAQASDRDGLRCAVQGTRRHGGRSADANGDVGLTNNGWGGASAPPAGIAIAGGAFAAGQTRFFQVTHREDALLSCMRGLNTTQAVGLTFTGSEKLKK